MSVPNPQPPTLALEDPNWDKRIADPQDLNDALTAVYLEEHARAITAALRRHSILDLARNLTGANGGNGETKL